MTLATADPPKSCPLPSGERSSSLTPGLLTLTVGALGIVFGDIGTSPLYTVRTCFAQGSGVQPMPLEVLGIVSLILWSLTLIVSIKYLCVILRADLNGEGGILALTSLVTSSRPVAAANRWLIPLGLFGAALLLGDGMITPAMSVLSAVEGVELAEPKLSVAVVPICIVLLLVLFAVQRRGTATIGNWFGPIMLLWFLTIAVLGIRGICLAPEVLRAIDPSQALLFFQRHTDRAFLVLGFVFLAVTGGEALYADLGHFGRRPIRWGWFAVAFPALGLNYLGQGGLILHDASAADHSFYQLAPGWSLYPLVGLATIATFIASQAVVSGAFSLAHQARQLGYFPNIQVQHYSEDGEGKVYVPLVNWVLAVATVLLVLAFRTSAGLAGAYGMAVSGTMLITTLLAVTCFWRIWNWSWIAIVVAATVFLAVDTTFLAANMMKLLQGGWIPLLVAAAVYLMMSTWRLGRSAIEQSRQVPLNRLADLHAAAEKGELARVPGTAVYFASTPTSIPLTLLANAEHNHVLHEQVVLLTIVTEHRPRVPLNERLEIQPAEFGFRRLIAHYGFMQTPHVPSLMQLAAKEGLVLPVGDITYIVRSEEIVLTKEKGMPAWRKRFYALISRNSQDVSAAWSLPPQQTVGIRLSTAL